MFFIYHMLYMYTYNLSLDKTELRTENTEPVLLQMSKGKIVFWHIFLFET